MVLKNKITNFLHRQLSLSVLDIALASIFVALWVVSAKTININLGFMRIGILYAWVIIIGLIFKPFLAFIITIIADNLVQMLSGFGFWMIEYALIYPAMVLCVSFLKKIMTCQNDKIWALLVSFIMFFTLIFSSVISVIYLNFEHKSSNEDGGFIFNSLFVHLLLWFFIALITVIFVILMIKYFKTKKMRLKINISIGAITTLMMIMFVWLWGPIAQIRFLVVHMHKNTADLFANYDLFFVPRVLKTPIILPIYILIISNVYYAYDSLSIKKQNQW